MQGLNLLINQSQLIKSTFKVDKVCHGRHGLSSLPYPEKVESLTSHNISQLIYYVYYLLKTNAGSFVFLGYDSKMNQFLRGYR